MDKRGLQVAKSDLHCEIVHCTVEQIHPSNWEKDASGDRKGKEGRTMKRIRLAGLWATFDTAMNKNKTNRTSKKNTRQISR